MDGQVTVIDYFMYADACAVWLGGWDTRFALVGVAVDHLGGKSTGLNKHTKFDFEGEHAWLYQELQRRITVRSPVRKPSGSDGHVQVAWREDKSCLTDESRSDHYLHRDSLERLPPW